MLKINVQGALIIDGSLVSFRFEDDVHKFIYVRKQHNRTSICQIWFQNKRVISNSLTTQQRLV